MVSIHNAGAEQLAGIVSVLLAVVFRQQFLMSLVLFVETFDGLHHKGVNNLLVVVPIDALLLQQTVEVGIVLDERTIQLTPQLAVGVVVVF